MRPALASLLLVAAPASAADPAYARLERYLPMKDVRVTWNAVAAPDPASELEVDAAYGHGGGMIWYRFRPDGDGVDVLSVRVAGAWDALLKKGPPEPPVTVARAWMKAAVYADFVHAVAAVNAAGVQPKPRNSVTWSSADMWAHARLSAAADKVLFETAWSGYLGSSEAAESAKPRAAVAMARAATAKLKFAATTPTPEERAWVTAKAERDRMGPGRTYPGWASDKYDAVVAEVGQKKPAPAK